MSALTSQTAYSVFITYQLAIDIGVINHDLEYDLAWEEAGKLYVKFCDSGFDVPNKSEYDAIEEFLKHKKALQEAKKIEGERTITISMSRTYSKYAEVRINLPKSMSTLEVQEYLENNYNLYEDLEDRLAKKSLDSGDTTIEYYDDLTFKSGTLSA